MLFSNSAEGVVLSTEDIHNSPYTSPVQALKVQKVPKASSSRILDPLPKRPETREGLNIQIDHLPEGQPHLKPIQRSPNAETEIKFASDPLGDIRFEEDPGARERSHSVPEIERRMDIKEANMSHLLEPYLYFVDPVTGKETKFNIINQTTNIGRKEDNDLILFSKYVSRYHCRLDVEVTDGQTILVFKDLSSRSRINGEKPVQHRMVKGDVIKIGKTIILYMGKIRKKTERQR